MSELALILPSRGRPERIEPAIDAWRRHSTVADLVVCLDDDDDTLGEYRRHDDVTYRVGPRLRMCPTVNAAALELAGEYRCLGFIGDDHVIGTYDWDGALLGAVGDWGIGYGNDLLQGEQLATHCVLTSNIVAAVGYMALPGTTHLYMDNFWMVVGRGCGFLRYLPEVVVEHVHPFAGKAEMDDRYAEVNSAAMYADDRAVFERWLESGQADADVAKVKAAMDG